MFPQIQSEATQLFAEKTTQTRMDARLARRLSLRHTAPSLPTLPQQRQLYVPPSLERGYVMEPLVLKESMVDAGELIAVEPVDVRDHAGKECTEEDEDSAWLNDRVLPRPALSMTTPILKDQSADQQTLTCWL